MSEEIDVFRVALGSGQGWTEPGIFVLGHLDAGRFAELSSGDFVEISQEMDLTDVDMVRLEGRFEHRGNGAWLVSILIDGEERARRVFERSGTANDIAATTQSTVGNRRIVVRLQAE